VSGFILFILILIPQEVLPQEENYSKIYELGGITITAKRIELIPNQIIEINLKDLQNRGVSTVGQALRFTPSIYMRIGRKGENRIEIFGIEQREIVVMSDGHPIYCPYEGGSDLDLIPLDNISKIEVALPPVSLLHGANSLGGVVNIVSKKYAKCASMGFSEGMSMNSVVNYGDKLGDLFYYLTYGISKSSGYPLPDGTIRENSDYYKRRYTGKIGWEVNSTTEFGISAANYWNEKGIPPGLTNPKYWRFTDWKWQYIAIHGKTELSQKLKFKGSGFYDTHKNTLISYEDSTYTDKEWVSDYDNNTTGAYMTVSLKSGKFNTSLGGSFKIDRVNIEKSEESKREHRGQTVSLSIQEKILIPILRMHLQGEVGYDGFSGTESLIHCINYRAGGVFLIDTENTLSFSIGKKTRFPTLKELYSPSSGNPDLFSEGSMSYQFGINLRPIKMVFFLNNITNLIDLENRYTNYENLNWARLQGFSISGEYKFFTLNYTYLDAYTESYEALNNRPKNSLNFGFNYEFNFGLSTNLNSSWIDRRKDGDDYLKPYTLIDANISQKIDEFVTIQLGCFNITNEWYEEEMGYPLAGRTFNVKFLVNLEGGNI